MRVQADGGAIIGRPKPLTLFECLAPIAVFAAVIYLLFFSNKGVDIIKPVKDAGYFGYLDFNEYISSIYGHETELTKNVPVVNIQKSGAGISAADKLYRQDETISLDVSMGADSLVGGAKYRIRQVQLVSPKNLKLYNNPDAGFGNTVTFTQDIRTQLVYGEKDTVAAELALNSIITGDSPEKISMEFEISYVYAQVLGDTVSTGLASQTVTADLYKADIGGKTGYILRDPDRPTMVWAVNNGKHSWTVEINLQTTEVWDNLLHWSPIYHADTDTILYAGVKDGRYDYVIIRGSKRKNSFNGEGYSAFGDVVPIFDNAGHAAFCARRGKQWCMIYDGTEFPFHDGIGASSIALLDDGRFLYAALDNGSWSVILASPKGTEFAVYSGIEGINNNIYSHPVYASQSKKIAFMAVQKNPKALYVVHSEKKAVDLSKENIKENFITDQAYSKISEFWWSPEEELVYAGKSLESSRYNIVINGKEYTYDQAQAYLLAQCTGVFEDRRDEVQKKLNELKTNYDLK